MLRHALAAVLLAVPAFADDEEPMRTEPLPSFAAEAVVKHVAIQSEGGVDWAEVTFQVSRCTGGACQQHQSVKVLVPVSQWRGKHGQTMGVVRYDWKDKAGSPHRWAVALHLDDNDELMRFEHDSDHAVAAVGTEAGDSAVATR